MKNNKINSICLTTSVITGAFLLLSQFSFIFTAKTIYAWISIICFMVFLLLFLIILIWSTVHLIVAIVKKKRITYTILPLIVGIITIIALDTIPIDKLGSSYIYSRDIDGYQSIVEMIESGELNDTSKFIKLPTQYSSLSDDGEIIVKR